VDFAEILQEVDMEGDMKMWTAVVVMCLLAPLAVSSNAEPVEEKALRFVGLLRDGEFNEAFGMCDETLAEALSSPEGLKGLWSQITVTFGDLEAIEGTKSEVVQNYSVVTVKCRFANGPLSLRISLDEEERIAGIFLVSPETDFEAVSRSAVELMSQRKFDEVAESFAEGAKVSARELRREWYDLMLKSGRYEGITKIKVTQLGSVVMSTVGCNFTRYPVNVVLYTNLYGKIIGLQLYPYPPPDYADTISFTEVECAVGSLPATLTMPKGKGPFPAVVLVHGSGPNDRDETLGPNKVFRDIAWGLASQGIAVLRYDKYSYVYDSMPENISDRDLLVANALSAVDLLKSDANVEKVFVLGHSEGGWLAPLIAEESNGAVDGLIILAGPTKSMPAVLLGQFSYLLSHNDGRIDENEAVQIEYYKKELERLEDPAVGDDELIMGMKKSYWKYDPAKTARALTQPMLVLQGGMDYQVTLEDFEGWIAGLAGKDNVTFRMYPALFHLFMKGSLDNADYEKAGHVEKDVIDDIVGWINN
jgi:dienelactone hydrolase